MIAASVWGSSGWTARARCSVSVRGVLVTLIAGFGGSMIGFLATHELLGIHEMHLFAPEGLLPASVGALMVLLAADRVRRAARHKTKLG